MILECLKCLIILPTPKDDGVRGKTYVLILVP